MRVFIIALILLALGLSCRAAAETQCKLIKIIDLPTSTYDGSTMLVPLKIAGRDTKMTVDTGAYWSVIVNELAAGLEPGRSRVGLVDAAGTFNNATVKIPELELGQVKITDIEFFLERSTISATILGGNLGMNVLGMGDLEIDPRQGRVAIFSKAHCPDQVVYWPQTDAVKIPFEIAKSHHIIIPVQLDGVPLRALLDTGAGISVLPESVAGMRFDLHKGDKGMEPSAEMQTFSKLVPSMKYQFKSLTVGGVTFQHPWIGIAAATVQKYEFDMVLGMHQLRMLHMYIDYADSALFASTAAGDSAAASAASSQGTKSDTSATAIAPLAGSSPAATGLDARGADLFDYSRVKGQITRGSDALTHGNADQAIAEFDDALSQVPRAPQLLVGRALAYALKHDFRRAFGDVNAAITDQPIASNAYLARGNIYAESGDLPRAFADANYVASLNPRSPATLAEVGWTLLRARAPEAALADFDAAIKLQPKGADLHVGRGVALTRMHRDKEAIYECNRAVELGTTDIPVSAYLGLVHLDMGNVDDAAQDFEAALIEKPGYPLALYGRSLVRGRKGDTDGAAADLAAAKHTEPFVNLIYPTT